MKAWFMQLRPRERRLVAFAGALLLVFLVYLLVWQPFTKHLKDLRQTVEEQEASVQWMQGAAREVEQLRATNIAPGKLPPGQSLLAVVDQSAKTSNLGPAMKRVEPEGTDTTRVSFEQANFDDLIVWLEGLKTTFGVSVSNIVLERQDTPGLVNARVTLQGGA